MYGEQDDLWNGMAPEGQIACGAIALLILLGLIALVVYLLVRAP